jgi:hypothetical protein
MDQIFNYPASLDSSPPVPAHRVVVVSCHVVSFYSSVRWTLKIAEEQFASF